MRHRDPGRTVACGFGAKQFAHCNCKLARRTTLIALVRSLVNLSLWVQSGLAMNCLAAVCLLPQS